MTTVLATGTAPAYPVHLTAPPVPDRLSRGLWLVKWILVVPHVVVLALLWPAFVVLSAVALVSILVTGRYPRAIFDFNVGVLRWTWRVSYYSYGVLGTDRYPPFTLQDVPDYPARLDIDYPGQLSRGRALVQWWLLVLPHYLVLGAFTYAGVRLADQLGRADLVLDLGLVSVLTLIVGFALLFTGRYPQGLYDLLLGISRWTLRVGGYAALMTDVYPPFRLDQGGRVEPQDTLPPAVQPAGAAPVWSAGTVTAVVAGSVAVLLGAGLGVGGGILLAAPEDGFVTSPTFTVSSSGYAVSTEPALLKGSAVDDALGTIRVRAETTDGEDVFVGIAPAADAQAYLAGVQHTELTGAFPGRDRQVNGHAPETLPQLADVWVASASGPGRRTAEVEAQPGSWVAVVMPADGSAGVKADVDVAATLPWLTPLAGGMLATGVLLLAGGAAALALAVRAASEKAR
ncbi:DUF4389 domain-containing protein [Ornithinimicrobium avium]|uniref:DUF4389 domain-containing protein n=1 Tax=Ornithinimicrobium avium TaxID=2283195 RepID=A0A345NKS5_9MICO|nr:DUF4389 domain-containing protein [Ornithinimicrobium avium]AXH95633.1 DUF4389 domain-containing protein [Ornithinimicrobium avium]